jgi:cysteine desulfurase / selenocysteine lyase
VTDTEPSGRLPDIRAARDLFPATASCAFFNTAAVGLASRRLADSYHELIDDWVAVGFDYVHGEQAANKARSTVARLIGADSADVALIPSISSAAGLVAAQFGHAERGESVVIGELEYSSNHFRWRQLARKGYDVRQVPFRNGGVQPEDVANKVDARTRLVAFSAVQSATGHRSDVAAISRVARAVGAIVFVDGSQMVGALPVADLLPHADVMAWPDHKFLLNAGRGMGTASCHRRCRSGLRRSMRGGGRLESRSRASSVPPWISHQRHRGSTRRSAGWRQSGMWQLWLSLMSSGRTVSTHATAS